MFTARMTWRCVAAISIGVLGHGLRAQDTKPPVQFPTEWVNHEPISVENLKGKAAFLYFYEEKCPKCRDKWPGLFETAKKYSTQPIVFIAVNSGTTTPLVEQYAKQVGLDWPVIVDSNRSFEQACGVGEVSLQNVMQVAYLTADGKIERGRWSDIEGTIEQALRGAKWNVDPADMPQELMPVWRNVEFGEYVEAAPVLAKHKSSRKGDIKAAAVQLAEFIATHSKSELAAARKEAETSKYRGYERYGVIAARFAGYPAAAEAAAARREIAQDPALRKELVAIKQFEKQSQLLDSAKPAVRERARAALQKIVDESPDSEAARRAKAALSGP